MDRRRSFEATLGSMLADVSKLTLSADMSDSRLPLFEIISVFVFSAESSSSMDSTLSHDSWSIAGHLEPRRMYFLRLSVDCKNESFWAHSTALGGELNLDALLNETAFFGIPFVILVLEFVADVADVALIAVIVWNGLWIVPFALTMVTRKCFKFVNFCEEMVDGREWMIFARGTSENDDRLSGCIMSEMPLHYQDKNGRDITPMTQLTFTKPSALISKQLWPIMTSGFSNFVSTLQCSVQIQFR